MKKKIAIIGAGISGLCLAYFLERRFGAEVDVRLFEARSCSGGWIQTTISPLGLFECGPRSLRMRKDDALSRLITELGIQDACITAAPAAKNRFLAKDGALFGVTLGRLLCSSYAPTFISGVCRDLFVPRGTDKEESVARFFTRRFGRAFTDAFINPLCAGIFAASPDLLSMPSAFTSLVEQEQRYRSLVFGALCSKPNPHKIISFEEGIHFLPQTIEKALTSPIHYNTPVRQIVGRETGCCIVTDERSYEVDHAVCTASPGLLCELFCHDDPLARLLACFEAASVAVVSFGFLHGQSPEGFGFLCSEHEEKELLGIVFDSSVFPQHNRHCSIRLSVMMGGTRSKNSCFETEEQLVKKARSFVEKYLGIATVPDAVFVHRLKNAIGLYSPGFQDRVQVLQALAQKRSLSFLGSAFSGISVPDCIQSAFRLSEQLLYKN